MKKEDKVLNIILGFILTVTCATCIYCVVKKPSKKDVQKDIEQLGLAHYNYAAGMAKKKGLIEEDAKISSIEEIQSLNKEQVELVGTVLNLIADGKVSIGPARDAHGHFIKTEKEGE